MIDFVPEPLEKLKARFHQAIDIVWVMAENMKDVPSNNREHVFDCDDGIRLVISTNKIQQEENIYFQGSVNEIHFKGKLDETLMGKFADRFRQISGEEYDVYLLGLDKKAIPHFIAVKSKQ